MSEATDPYYQHEAQGWQVVKYNIDEYLQKRLKEIDIIISLINQTK